MTAALVRYETMTRAIIEAHTVDEVKDIHDKAVALESYARQAKDTELEDRVRKIRIRAERRAGELLVVMPKADGGDAQRTRFRKGTESPQTLSDMGITKKQSMTWQALAAVPEDDFESALACGKRVSTSGIIRQAKEEREGVFSPIIKPSDNWNFSPVEYGRIDESGESHGYIPGEIYANWFWYFCRNGDEVCDLMAGSGQAMRVYEERARWGKGREIDFNLRLFDRKPRGRYATHIEPLDATRGLPDGYRPDAIFMDVPYFRMVEKAYSDDASDIANMEWIDWLEAMRAVAKTCADAQDTGSICTVMAPNTVDWEEGRVMVCDFLRQTWKEAGYELCDIAYSTRRIQQDPGIRFVNNKAKEKSLMLSDIAEIQTFIRGGHQ